MMYLLQRNSSTFLFCPYILLPLKETEMKQQTLSIRLIRMPSTPDNVMQADEAFTSDLVCMISVLFVLISYRNCTRTNDFS